MTTLRFMTAGESHGPRLTAILEGIPAGLKLSKENIDKDLARRQQGYGRGGRMKIETDRVDVLSGVRFGETLGGPLTLSVTNRDWENWTDRMSAFGEPAGDKVTAARPGHADLVGVQKYDRKDIRDILERSSARETAMRVSVGGVCKELLRACGMEVVSHVVEIGGVKVDEAKIDRAAIGSGTSELNCYDAKAEEKMKERIREAMAAGDTLGGVFEVIVRGAPIGLGSHIQWDRRLDASLAGAMMSIQAIKGVEIGDGFAAARSTGSRNNDPMLEGGKFASNHAGGILGGISSGQDIIVKAAVKPIASIPQEQRTIDIDGKPVSITIGGRHDLSAIPRCVPVHRAMVSLVLADAVLLQRRLGRGL